MSPSAGSEPERRVAVLEATVAEVEASGIRGLRVVEVARRAGVGRATVYRYFPDGRDQLVGEAITWEVSRFFTELAEAVNAEGDLAARLDRALVEASTRLADHAAFQRVLAEDRARLLKRLHEIGPMLIELVAAYLAPYLADEALHPDLTVPEAADYLARMVLGFMTDPGSWDLTDPDERRHLIHTQFLSAVRA